MVRRAEAAAVLMCALALVACTPSRGVEPTPSIVPGKPTPAETEFERQQKLDFAAAEKAYRTFRTEYRRVTRAGGSKEPTKIMRATAGGPYLEEFAKITQSYAKIGAHQTGTEKIVYARLRFQGDTSVTFSACEDMRSMKTYLRSGKLVGPGELRAVELEAKRVGSAWKVWKGTGKKVASCE